VGGPCSTHGTGEKNVQGFGGKARGKETIMKTKTYMGEWDKNGCYGNWLGAVEWIQLAQDRGQWRALVNTVMNLPALAPRS
jgi:hypothetical protein